MASDDPRRGYDEPWRSEFEEDEDERRRRFGRGSYGRPGRESRARGSWFGRGRDERDEPRYGYRGRWHEPEPWSGRFEPRFDESGSERWGFRRGEPRWGELEVERFGSGGYGGSTHGAGFPGSGGRLETPDSGRSSPSGRFAGRGPRGYRRSDERIREDVNDRLMEHPDIDPSDIEVQVNDCEVVLIGEVDERRDKRLAEDIAESVLGVREVHNQLRVRRRGLGTIGATGGSAATWTGTGSIRTGMEVLGSDNERVGEVKEVRGSDFLLDRPMARDLYVPMHAIRETRDGRILLDVASERVDEMGWPTTATAGGGSERRR